MLAYITVLFFVYHYMSTHTHTYMHVDTWKVPSSPPTNRNVSTNVCFMLWSFVLCSNSEQEYEGYMKVNYCAKIGILKLVRFILGNFRQFLWWSSPGSCPGDAIWRALATMSWSLPFVLLPPWGCARGKGRPGRSYTMSAQKVQGKCDNLEGLWFIETILLP